jgi:DNA helicase HerA-like ATPase
LLVLENQGAAGFFGEPELDIDDFLRIAPDGRGFINILSAGKLMRSPRLYAIFLLWMLSELFEKLPEVGDLEKPKLVFFFDEAHLLFDNAPKNLLSAIEQVVRLIRSKGVGVYFVTQNPADVPETVLGQLGNRVQHALRAFTPRDQKAVKSSRRYVPQEPYLRHSHRDHQPRGGRSPGFDARCQGQPRNRRKESDRAANGKGRSDHRRGAPAAYAKKRSSRQIRHTDRPPIRLRNIT